MSKGGGSLGGRGVRFPPLEPANHLMIGTVTNPVFALLRLKGSRKTASLVFINPLAFFVLILVLQLLMTLQVELLRSYF